jgi:hypothetical protein
MSRAMILRLMRKDLHFYGRDPIGFVVAGLVAVAILCLPGMAAFYGGGVLMITVLTTFGMHLPVKTILNERRNKTLPLLMSLPISPADYTWSKMLFCLGCYVAGWSVLLAATVAAILYAETRPDGVLPFIVIGYAACAANAVLVLASAMVRDSLDKTMRAVVFWNVVLQVTVFFAAANPAIHAGMDSDRIVWGPDALGFLAGAVAMICLGLGLTFWLQSRKTQLV